MSVQGQTRLALPDAMPPAERDFYLELRRLIDIAGFSVRTLEDATFSEKTPSGKLSFYSKSQWSRWINGRSRPPRRAVTSLTAKLTEEGIDGERLVDLWDKAFAPAPHSQSQGTSPRQLPAGVAYFTGRAAELEALTKLAGDAAGASETVVIAAISGTAGVGKTALAVHWARQAAHQFPDGQLFVNLRGYDPAGVPVAPAEAIRDVLDTLAVPAERVPASLDAQAAMYRSALAGRRVLLVLDNAHDADQVRPLLPGSPGSMVIVTSRSQLTGLAAADGAVPLNLDLLSEQEARELLASRIGAQRVTAEPGAAADLLTLCARLPLALCIVTARAAARPSFPLSALTSGLRDAEDRLDALDAGEATGSVRAAISCSYGELHAPAARMFRLLSLHPGPDVTVAASASLAGITVAEARRALAQLTEAHLLAEHVPGRFSSHDLIGAFAEERAAAGESPDERHEAVHRLLDHYVHTAHCAARLISPSRDPIALSPPSHGVTPEQLADNNQALAWLQAEYHVLLAATSLADRTRADIHAWQIPWTLADFLDRRGHWHEWAAIQRTAVAAATRLGDTAGQAASLRYLANACTELGEYDQALANYAAALALYQQLGDRLGQAQTHQLLAVAADSQGRYADELSYSDQALRLYQAIGHRPGEARMLNNIGWTHVLLGDYRQAREFCQQALTLTAELGHRYEEANVWDTLGYAEHHLGNLAEAVVCYERALSLFREFGDLLTEAQALSHLGDTHHAAGDPGAARRVWQEAVNIYDDLHRPDAAELRAKLSQLPGTADGTEPTPSNDKTASSSGT